MGKQGIQDVKPRRASPAPQWGDGDGSSSAAHASKWTESQLRGIRASGHSLLLSAAAGSGKTAVLAERCAHLVCEAEPPCDVDNLLVVTFTDAAAAEMRSRIERSLRKRLAGSAGARAQRLSGQLTALRRANISTLHSFCSRLLRQHFHLVGLDPNFTVMDADEAQLLRGEVARRLFGDRYETDESGEFQRFVDTFGDGNDEPLICRVVETHELLSSLVNPLDWLNRAKDRIAEGAKLPLEQSELGAALLGMIRGRLEGLVQSANAAVGTIQRLGRAFDKYLVQLNDVLATLAHCERLLEEDGLDALREEVVVQWPPLPSISNSVPNKAVAFGAISAVKDELKKTGPLWDLLRFSEEELRDGLRATLPHAGAFLSLVLDFSKAYAAEKSRQRALDFADLERFALKVLRDSKAGDAGRLCPSAAARFYHNQFHHVLVDEYQDINEVQDAILHLVSRECLTGGKGPGRGGANLFAVGDVKQSIYRFRLADPTRFLERLARFADGPAKSGGEVVHLRQNFRSRGQLLEAINGVFERLMTKEAADLAYDASQRLQAGLEFPGAAADTFAGGPIELHVLPSEAGGAGGEGESEGAGDPDRSEVEATLLARRIRQMMGLDGSPRMRVTEKDAAGGWTTRPLRYGDMVILLRALQFKADQFADTLRRHGIPTHSEGGTGFFDSPEIRDVLALLQVLDNARQDVPLAAVLRSPLANLPEAEDNLARIRLASDAAVPFHEAVFRYVAEKDDALAAHLRDFLARVAHWRDLAHKRPLAEVLWTIYDATGYLAYCAGLEDGEQRVANLLYLHQRATQFGTFLKQGLYRFLRFLEQLRAERDLARPSPATAADDVVRIMSVHRSKGLEFPVVLLPDLGKRVNLQDCAGPILTDRTTYLGMSVPDEERRCRYPSLASLLVQQRLRQQTLAEELRLLYVAMTRAKEHLVLVGTCDAEAPERWQTLFSSHAGPLPAEVILSAKCPLEWLGAVAACCAASEPIRIARHTAEEVASWEAAEQSRPKLSAEAMTMAGLRPLDAKPAPSAVADEIVRRLSFAYPHSRFTGLAAVKAMTTEGSPAARTVALPLPRSLASGVAPTAADRGTITHVALRHLDFSRPCTPGDVRAQVDELIARRFLTAAEAAVVDVGAVEWLLGTDVGELLRTHAELLRREVPVYLASAAPDLPNATALDQVMLRGRVDVLVPTPAGVVLIDYKTDDLAAAEVPSRAAAYLPHLSLYGRAITTMTGQRLLRAHLVFLSARVIHATS